MFEQAHQVLQEYRGRGAVEDAVIDGQGELQCGCGGESTVAHDGFLLDGADGQDRGLGRVDDGGEVIDAVHPEVADRECAAGHSSGVSLPERARSTSACALTAIVVRLLRSASRTTGTSSPLSTATAQPMFTWR